MDPRKTLALCLSAAVAASAATTILLYGPRARGPAPDAGRVAISAGESHTLAALARAQDDLARELRDLRHGAMSYAPREGTRHVVVDVDAAIERWMAARMPEFLAGTAEKDEASVRGDEEGAAVATLLDVSLDAEARAGALRRLRETGRLPDAIAALEEQVRADPLNPRAHQSLAEAYLERIQTGTPGEEAGELADLADRSLSRALELDPRNWEARFTKATSLTYWPAASGKQAEAIEHFETLLDQQGGRSYEPRFAQTHALLGDLYARSGNQEKAIQIWQHGLSLYPQSKELHGLLGLAED